MLTHRIRAAENHPGGSLASMTLEDILTNRNRVSEDILRDVKNTATGYGVTHAEGVKRRELIRHLTAHACVR